MGERSASRLAEVGIARSRLSTLGSNARGSSREPCFATSTVTARSHPLVCPAKVSRSWFGNASRRRGIDPAGFSGHSLQGGVLHHRGTGRGGAFKIRNQSGHASDGMLQRYVRDGEIFVGNAAGAVL